ncbi:SPOR domain-containing protein [Sphingomonas sp. Tas61C01]|uniref:SPOR domain-containing protein n=1 Tax=Sphingomonas sp. Tas61C01 TaxID=3458297 RepID=UPI00403EBBFC
MKIRLVLTLGLSALVFGGTMVGCTAGGGTGVASASDRNTGLVAKAAADNARKAEKALARRDAGAAIRFAEAAVQLAPRTAGYRMLLGQSYLEGGRFASAQQVFSDVLTLSPGNSKAALNLALTKVATGDWAGARRTLDANAAVIPAADRGLAMALAGDPNGAVALLTQVARTPEADAKVRQNLALSFALAGQWNMARVVAATDMSPADVDHRIEEWAAFAQPQAASDQIATLLGVKAAADGGMPVALALNASAPVMPAAVAVEPVRTAAVEPMVVPVSSPIAAPSPVPAMLAKIAFAAPSAVVQPLPVTLIRADRIPMKVFRAAQVQSQIASRVAAKGNWYVQIGAFQNAGTAKNGWSQASRRFAVLQGHVPTGTAFSSKTGSFYRLSVGGFTRGDADAMCRRYRDAGGACFVRAGAGDQTAQWLRKPDTQLASS